MFSCPWRGLGCVCLASEGSSAWFWAGVVPLGWRRVAFMVPLVWQGGGRGASGMHTYTCVVQEFKLILPLLGENVTNVDELFEIAGDM